MISTSRFMLAGDGSRYAACSTFRPSVGPSPAPNSRGPGAPGPIVTRCEMRSGVRAAKLIAVMPPMELPTKAAFSMPSASSS
jgi:hypothetical protein